MLPSSGRLRRILLLYLVILGSIPYLDGFTHPHSPEGFHPRHNVQLGWKLMHVAPALAGIGVALSLMSRCPAVAFPALAILTLQIVIGVADYRRIGFNATVPREFSGLDYFKVAAPLAVPFALYGFYRWRRERQVSTEPGHASASR